jgi:hypothetical protein
MDIGTIQRIGDLIMRYGFRSQLALLDCTSSRRSTVICALSRATEITTEYQRDSSSKRPMSSVALVARRSPARGNCRSRGRERTRPPLLGKRKCRFPQLPQALDNRSFHIRLGVQPAAEAMPARGGFPGFPHGRIGERGYRHTGGEDPRCHAGIDMHIGHPPASAVVKSDEESPVLPLQFGDIAVSILLPTPGEYALPHHARVKLELDHERDVEHAEHRTGGKEKAPKLSKSSRPRPLDLHHQCGNHEREDASQQQRRCWAVWEVCRRHKRWREPTEILAHTLDHAVVRPVGGSCQPDRQQTVPD